MLFAQLSCKIIYVGIYLHTYNIKDIYSICIICHKTSTKYFAENMLHTYIQYISIIK